MEKDLDGMKKMRVWLSEWYDRENGRSARLYHDWQGYTVEFLKDQKIIESRSMWDHNRDYAEDACENWVEEVIK